MQSPHQCRRCRMKRPHTVMADKLRVRRSAPPHDQPWVWLTREMLESEAWRTAPINTLRVVFRLILEHMAHAGCENGNLICTYLDFEKWGISSRLVSRAIADAMNRGLIVITQKGKASSGQNRKPSLYALGWLATRDGASPLNRWKGWKKPARPSIPQTIESTLRCEGRKNGANIRPSPSDVRAGNCR
jgi:hypothetical protein